MSKTNRSGTQLLWVMAIAIALIVLTAMTYFLAIYRDAAFCPQCWKERFWLAQRWVKKMLSIPQETLCIRGSCKSNLKQLAIAMELYARDNGGKLPSHQNWEQQTIVYLKNSQIYKCPDATTTQKRYYCMNPHLSGKSLKKIPKPSKTILLYECNDGKPISRHHFLEFGHFCNVAFADGRVKHLPAREVERRLGLTRNQQ